MPLDVLTAVQDTQDHDLVGLHAIQNMVGLKRSNSRATQLRPLRRCLWKRSYGSEHTLEPPKIDIGVSLTEVQKTVPIESHDVTISMGGEPMPHWHRQ